MGLGEGSTMRRSWAGAGALAYSRVEPRKGTSADPEREAFERSPPRVLLHSGSRYHTAEDVAIAVDGHTLGRRLIGSIPIVRRAAVPVGHEDIAVRRDSEIRSAVGRVRTVAERPRLASVKYLPVRL